MIVSTFWVLILFVFFKGAEVGFILFVNIFRIQFSGGYLNPLLLVRVFHECITLLCC